MSQNMGYPVATGEPVQPVIVPNSQPAAQPLDFTLQAHPVPVTCPHCNRQGVTIVKSRIGILQWLICFVLCLMGFWCCCCIPCYISDLREASHTCQFCNTYLGSSSLK